jgi:hypothetical protein
MSQFVLPRQTKINVTGNPYAGAQAFFYLTGTQTPHPVYHDAALTVAHDFPVLAHDDGYWPVIWLDPAVTYQVRILSATGVELDNVPDIPGGISALDFLAAQPSPSPSPLELAAGITPTNYAYPPGNVLRYGADPTGANDSTNAFNAATLASFAPIEPTAYRTAYVPAGRYKLTSTVYVPTGTILHGDGMSSYIDASTGFVGGTTDVFKLGWSLIGATPTKGTIYLTGGFPPEIYGLFVNGGPASASVVNIDFPGVLCHDIWFAAPGQAVYLAGGYVYNCEVDGGLTGMTIGAGTNQTINNVRFFNQNIAINFDGTTGDSSDHLFIGCNIEYPKVVGVQMGAGTKSIKGVKFQGCKFINNPVTTLTSFANCVSIGLANAQVELNDCSFHNWGQFGGGSPTAAILVQAAGAIVDVKSCLFDGAPTNSTYTASTTALALQLNQGTLRVTDSQFRHLPFGGGVLNYGGSAQCVCEMDGIMYSDLLCTTATNISNSNAASTFYVGTIKGDGATPFVNAQSTVPLQMKNMSRWFGPIGTSGGSSFITVPYQYGTEYEITLTANQGGGAGVYRKTRTDRVIKDNDFNVSAKSFLTQSTIIQGPDRSGTTGTTALTLTVEFGAVGGTATIANSNSGVLAVSWPVAYTNVSIDIQLIQSG